MNNFTYVASRDQLTEIVQVPVTRLDGALLSCGVHPRLSDRNFKIIMA